VDLRLPVAGTVAVHGANGSGKSTLLRLAAGVSVPSAGRVTRAPGLRVGLLPERPRATPALRAGALLAHLARLRGAPPHADAALVESLGAGDLLPARLGELSEGQLQRVALLAALAGDARLLVLDEPWRGLDARTGQELGLLLAERARGALVLVSDHGGPDRPPAGRVLEVAGGGVHERAVPAAPEPGVLVQTGPAATLPAGLAARGRRTAEGWELVLQRADLQAALGALVAAGIEVHRVEPRGPTR